MYRGVSSRGTVSSLDQRTGASRLYRNGGKKAVIVLFGHGSRDSIYALDDVEPFRYLYPVHEAGFPTASLDDHSPCRWGNSTMRTNIGTLKTNVQTALAASGKVHFVALSAGVTAAYNYAKNNPTHVQSIVGILPCVDIQAIYTGNLGGFASEISTAYAGAPSDANNPADNAGDFTAIPQLLYYNSDDPIATGSATTTFAATSGADLVEMDGSGHLYGSPLSGDDLADFITEND
jgi:predicted alpha/beta hydrolase family esterase